MHVVTRLRRLIRTPARPAGLRPLGEIVALVAAMALLGGCATRPVNAPLGHYDPGKAYRIERASEAAEDNATLVILAFSGGGTRAAAFSYGVLETLRDLEVTTKSGRHVRALDTVDVITGISGGSFTALAFGLYGDTLGGARRPAVDHDRQLRRQLRLSAAAMGERVPRKPESAEARRAHSEAAAGDAGVRRPRAPSISSPRRRRRRRQRGHARRAR